MYGAYQLSKRAIALLLLQNDRGVADLVARLEGPRFEDINSIVKTTQERFSQPLSYLIARQQREAAQRILHDVLQLPEKRLSGFSERLSEAMINPWTGIPILIVALYLLYEFVGVLGAQTLVAFFEETIFGVHINPWVDDW